MSDQPQMNSPSPVPQYVMPQQPQQQPLIQYQEEQQPFLPHCTTRSGHIQLYLIYGNHVRIKERIQKTTLLTKIL